ncbi:hypothetical protein BDW60DRAFT_124100 [Aspergillus nidulans var. acristatus]|jgi:hypothetical protein
MFSFRLKGCLPAEVEVCAVVGIYEYYNQYNQYSTQFTIQTNSKRFINTIEYCKSKLRCSLCACSPRILLSGNHQWPALVGAEWASEGSLPNGIMNPTRRSSTEYMAVKELTLAPGLQQIGTLRPKVDPKYIQRCSRCWPARLWQGKLSTERFQSS